MFLYIFKAEYAAIKQNHEFKLSQIICFIRIVRLCFDYIWLTATKQCTRCNRIRMLLNPDWCISRWHLVTCQTSMKSTEEIAKINNVLTLAHVLSLKMIKNVRTFKWYNGKSKQKWIIATSLQLEDGRSHFHVDSYQRQLIACDVSKMISNKVVCRNPYLNHHSNIPNSTKTRFNSAQHKGFVTDSSIQERG